MEFITLNTIITDLLNTIRGSKISQSETISRRQIEAWIHQYRALLIKRDVDAGKMPNPDYIQTIPSIRLEAVNKTADSNSLTSESFVLRTALDIPNTIDFNHKPGFTYIGTSDGNEIQLIPEGRGVWQQYKRFTPKEILAFLRDHRLYINPVTPISEITIRGIFEIPTDVSNFINSNSTVVTSTLDDRYPIPASMVGALKELILSKELGVIAKTPSDNKNDGANDVEVNAQ